jgi:hypothetical protein
MQHDPASEIQSDLKAPAAGTQRSEINKSRRTLRLDPLRSRAPFFGTVLPSQPRPPHVKAASIDVLTSAEGIHR